jgi:enoyl-CoA hydratase/3-hydroxyacyl-CoA dehydrogenase
MEVRKVAVIGAGDMGHGIAQVFATNGYNVVLEDKYPEMLEKAKVRIAASLQRWVERGKATKEQADATLSRIAYTGDLAAAVSDADLIVEAVPESLELKKSIFKEAAAHAPEGVIFASNTSNIRITDLAAATPRPGKVVGMHFFNPPTAMKLVEVIPGEKTDPAVVDEIAEISTKIGKTPVKVLKDSPGFIANRINAVDMLLFCLIADKGIASPPAVDTLFKSQGLPMGPYELIDFVGIDIPAESLVYFAKMLSPEYGKAQTFGKLVSEKKLGKKSGMGFYDWSTGRAAIPNAEPTDKVSMMDMFALEINEAVKLVEEGVATPEGIEKAVTLGMGRPFGPISVAKDLSNAEVKAKLEELAKTFDCTIFAPARSIVEGKMRDAIEGRIAPPATAAAAAAGAAAAPEKPAQVVGKATDAVRLERLTGGVAKIVLNRPRLNLISDEVLDGLDRILTELWTDQEVRVVVLTGEGSVFCAGADLSKYISGSVAFMDLVRKGERTFRRLTEIPKLTIAVLKGYALGGGLELALSCDLRVATEGVELGFPEVGIGLVPIWSGSQRLPRLIGTSLASSMILTCERIKGKRASEIGIVHKLVDSGNPDEAALKWASELSSSQAPVAVMLAKRLINKGAEVPSDVGLEMETIAGGVLYGTADFKEGISAMLGKRKPEYKGK